MKPVKVRANANPANMSRAEVRKLNATARRLKAALIHEKRNAH